MELDWLLLAKPAECTQINKWQGSRCIEQLQMGAEAEGHLEYKERVETNGLNAKRTR